VGRKDSWLFLSVVLSVFHRIVSYRFMIAVQIIVICMFFTVQSPIRLMCGTVAVGMQKWS
jgi:hypothetical protein